MERKKASVTFIEITTIKSFPLWFAKSILLNCDFLNFDDLKKKIIFIMDDLQLRVLNGFIDNE